MRGLEQVLLVWVPVPRPEQVQRRKAMQLWAPPEPELEQRQVVVGFPMRKPWMQVRRRKGTLGVEPARPKPRQTARRRARMEPQRRERWRAPVQMESPR